MVQIAALCMFITITVFFKISLITRMRDFQVFKFQVLKAKIFISSFTVNFTFNDPITSRNPHLVFQKTNTDEQWGTLKEEVMPKRKLYICFFLFLCLHLCVYVLVCDFVCVCNSVVYVCVWEREKESER